MLTFFALSDEKIFNQNEYLLSLNCLMPIKASGTVVSVNESHLLDDIHKLTTF